MSTASDETMSLVGIVNISTGDGRNDENGSLGTGPGDGENEDPVSTVKVIITVLFTLVFMVGVLGNVFVIVAATGRLRGLQKSMRVFILNLSVADLLYLLICLPFQATIITLPSWIFGGFMCKMVQFLTYVSMCASIFTLVAMSMDRYFAVAYPLKFFGLRTLRNSIFIIVSIWVIALGCSAPFLRVFLILKAEDESGLLVSYCVEGGWDNRTQRKRYYAFLFAACYMVPLLLMVLSYVLILRTLWRTFKPNSDTDSSSNKAKKKVTLIVSVVVLAFGICWLPHHVLYMWINFGKFPLTDGTLALKMMAVTLSSLNSSLNPIIYSIMSENFRQALKRCFWRCTSTRERTKVVPHHYRLKLLRSKRSFQV
ncbi:galanin receptor type 1-like [Acanthaster planci]|uniref:Galanin receptor type 1-like n=1 Tax=Acanthaster planci TaxID=133434 RepID=A0A8B7YSK7_ACAPL|nr:galanin receptor type 1-like [Acanthaster planci]XP_022095450.1 galanin receptor type 1-like [Acanthaster planci]